MLKKWVWVTVLSVIGIVALGFGGWALIDHYQYSQLVDQPSDVKKWEADPRPLQSKSAAIKQIKAIGQSDPLEKRAATNAKLVVIPGLRGAWSINAKTKKAGFGNNWVPQGFTQSKDAIYMSLYDDNHKLNSIIVQVNKHNAKYNKTLILRGKSHVGGITYDIDHQRLLLSDDAAQTKGAGISYVSQREIDAYSAKATQQPIKSTHIELHLARPTSAIALYNNQLVFVKYGQNKKNRSILALPLNANGLPAPITMKQKKVINSSNNGWDRLQGIAIAKSGLTLLSQSNGSAPGKIWILVPGNKSWTKLDFTAPKSGSKIINVPHSVEDISLDPSEKHISMIFESGAKAYREAGTFMHRPSYMDRVIILPVLVKKGQVQ
ncbi:hypothetical protein IMAU60045_02925 [Lactiplantibacillus plantarum]|nr:hypothetical protein [Lactiplantibacillus plantarum]